MCVDIIRHSLFAHSEMWSRFSCCALVHSHLCFILDMQTSARELSQLATRSRSIRKHTTTRVRCIITLRRSTSITREAHTSCTQTRTSLVGCSRPRLLSTRQEWTTKVVGCTSTTDSRKQKSRLKCISASTSTISNRSGV